MSNKRVFYGHEDLEEYADGGGMWRLVSGPKRQKFIEASAALMRDPIKFQNAMRRALREWPRSCAVNLETPGKNRRAWIGHAGCYLATGSPEECTRIGWHTLNDWEQYKANLSADIILIEFKESKNKAYQLGFQEEIWNA